MFFERLPLDLVASQLLPRVSLPQVFQLRCICKSWYVLLPYLLSLTPPSALECHRRQQNEAPWLVMARFTIDSLKSDTEKQDHSCRELVVYIPSLRGWFKFPLPFPSLNVADDKLRFFNNGGGGGGENRVNANISSLLGPAFQNTFPNYSGSCYYGSCYPLITSSEGGLICALIYNLSDKNNGLERPEIVPHFIQVEKVPIGQPLENDWARLLLFNPLNGKSRVVPLPSNNRCLLRHFALSVSLVQVYDPDNDDKFRNYVVLCPAKWDWYMSPYPIMFMYIYDIQGESWQGPITNGIIELYRVYNVCCSHSAPPITHTSIRTPDGSSLDILLDADILQYTICSSDESVLYGYSIKKNLWMRTYIEVTDRNVCKTGYTTVWRDSASGRIFLASSFRPSSKGLVSPDLAVEETPSTCTGFDVWELKHVHVMKSISETEKARRYYWHHLSRTPSKFWRHFYRSPQWDAGHRHNEVFFITSGRLVCMTAVDYVDSKSLNGVYSSRELKGKFPFGRYSRPLLYDILLDTWSQLPDPCPVTDCGYAQFPLFAFQPRSHTFA